MHPSEWCQVLPGLQARQDWGCGGPTINRALGWHSVPASPSLQPSPLSPTPCLSLFLLPAHTGFSLCLLLPKLLLASAPLCVLFPQLECWSSRPLPDWRPLLLRVLGLGNPSQGGLPGLSQEQLHHHHSALCSFLWARTLFSVAASWVDVCILIWPLAYGSRENVCLGKAFPCHLFKAHPCDWQA